MATMAFVPSADGRAPMTPGRARSNHARIPMPTEYTFTCATCDHEIVGRPVFHIGLTFCCAGCAADGPCTCSYDVEEPAPAVQLVESADEIVEPVGGRIFPEPRVREPATTPAVVNDPERLVAARR
jgi:transcription elongation factor Elf1